MLDVACGPGFLSMEFASIARLEDQASGSDARHIEQLMDQVLEPMSAALDSPETIEHRSAWIVLDGPQHTLHLQQKSGERGPELVPRHGQEVVPRVERQLQIAMQLGVVDRLCRPITGVLKQRHVFLRVGASTRVARERDASDSRFAAPQRHRRQRAHPEPL